MGSLSVLGCSAVTTKPCSLRGFCNGHLFSPSSGSCKSEVEVPAGGSWWRLPPLLQAAFFLRLPPPFSVCAGWGWGGESDGGRGEGERKSGEEKSLVSLFFFFSFLFNL